MKKIAISTEVAAVIGRADVAAAKGGWLLRLPAVQDLPAALQQDLDNEGNRPDPAGALPRMLYTAVDKVLRAWGGKWDRGAGGHRFVADPRVVIAEALATGLAVDVQKSLGQFFTPPALAARLVDLVALALPADPKLILEPSAGSGNLVEAACARWPASMIMAVEVDPTAAARVSDRFAGDENVIVHSGDFLGFAFGAGHRRYGAVLMNPPYGAVRSPIFGLGTVSEASHVVRAFDLLLQDGGALGAVLPKNAVCSQKSPAHRRLREIYLSYGVHREPCPKDSFREVGTRIDTEIVVLRRPALL